MSVYTKIFLKFPSKFWDDHEYILYASKERGRFPVFQDLERPGIYQMAATFYWSLWRKTKRDGLNDKHTMKPRQRSCNCWGRFTDRAFLMRQVRIKSQQLNIEHQDPTPPPVRNNGGRKCTGCNIYSLYVLFVSLVLDLLVATLSCFTIYTAQCQKCVRRENWSVLECWLSRYYSGVPAHRKLISVAPLLRRSGNPLI